MANEDNERALVTVDTGFTMAPAALKKRVEELLKYKTVMLENEDYGVIPGTQKPTLLQPGADSLCTVAGLGAGEPIVDAAVEDWETPFFYYRIKQPLINIETGQIVAWGLGSCNSREDRYRWRWVPVFAMTEQQKQDAPAEGWRSTKRKDKNGRDYIAYRMPNDDVYSQVNTIQKMAVKRAYIAATLRATGAHRVFTQDMEDMPGDVVNAEVREVPSDAPPIRGGRTYEPPDPPENVGHLLDLANRKLGLKGTPAVLEALGCKGTSEITDPAGAWEILKDIVANKETEAVQGEL